MPGQYKVGEALYHGLGIPSDTREAVKWLKLSSDQGNVPAKHLLAVAHFEGEGVRQNRKMAVTLFNEAALEGYGDSCIILGKIYLSGNLVERNFDKSFFWLKGKRKYGRSVFHRFGF